MQFNSVTTFKKEFFFCLCHQNVIIVFDYLTENDNESNVFHKFGLLKACGPKHWINCKTDQDSIIHTIHFRSTNQMAQAQKQFLKPTIPIFINLLFDTNMSPIAGIPGIANTVDSEGKHKEEYYKRVKQIHE